MDYKKLIEGEIPPYIRRFIKAVGKTILDFDMIRDGETILLGVSGGKDSLALALALSLRRKWLPIHYNIKAIMIDWEEHPIPKEREPLLRQYFKALDIDFDIVRRTQFPTSQVDDFNCYLCSRNRRKILFEEAQRLGCRQIALGHHLDDLVETTIMNLFFRAKFASMNPIQEFFDGQLYIMRPMIQVHENTIRRISQDYELPVVKPVCPYDQTNIRAELKGVVKSLVHMDHYAREHVYQAHKFETRIKR